MSKDLISVLVLPLGEVPSVFNKGCNSLMEYDFCVNEASCLMLSITSILSGYFPVFDKKCRRIGTVQIQEEWLCYMHKCSGKFIFFLARNVVHMSSCDFWPTVSYFSHGVVRNAKEQPVSDGSFLRIIDIILQLLWHQCLYALEVISEVRNAELDWQRSVR